MKSISYNLPIVRQIENAHLVDALPYCDEFSEDDRNQAMQMIEQEMKNTPKKDYLTSLKKPDGLFDSCPLFKQTLEGLKETGVDMDRYTELNSDTITDWQDANNRIQLLFAHSEIRRMNLDLLLEYGSSAWTQHNSNLTSYKERLASLVANLTQENDAINKERQALQINIKPNLSGLSSQYFNLSNANHALEAQKRKLQDEVEDLKRIKLNR